MKKFLLLPVVVLLSLVTACVSRAPETPPSWITGVEEEHPEGFQFIAYGRNSDRSSARDAAGKDALRRIEQIMVRELETYPITFDEELGKKIEETAGIRAENVERLAEYRRLDERNNYEVFQLLVYRHSELREDLETVTGRTLGRDTRESDRKEDDAEVGTYSGALGRVRTVLEADIPVASGDRETALNEALSAASGINITLRPGEITSALRDRTDHTVTVEVRDQSNSKSASLKSASPKLAGDGPVVVLRTLGPEVDGNRTVTRREVKTGPDGTATVAISPPQYAGVTNITAEPDWFDSLYRKWSAQATSSAEKSLLAALAERLRDNTVLRVTSQAATVPTAVIILDRDIAGNPITGNDAMAGTLQELGSRGFRVRRVDLQKASRDHLASLETVEVADLYDILPFDVLASVDRAIVGDARILSFDEDEGYSLVVELNAVAFDLRRDQQLARVTVTERITGSSAQAAIRAAFHESGRRLARRLAPQLP